MKYNKPVVEVLASAVDAIQSSQLKVIQRTFDGVQLATNAAYEADE